MASAIAVREGCPTVPDTPDDPAVLREAIRGYATDLNVVARLRAYRQALKSFEAMPKATRGQHFVLLLNPDPDQPQLAIGRHESLADATAQYQAIEAQSDASNFDVVLVTVDSVEALRRAYPSYFGDTSEFIRAVQLATK